MTETNTTGFDDDLKRQLEAVLASYFKRLQDARGTEDELARCKGERAELRAMTQSQRDLLASLEQQLLASQAREASALERVGVLTGVMNSHSASIADIVGRAQSTTETPRPAETPAGDSA